MEIKASLPWRLNKQRKKKYKPNLKIKEIKKLIQAIKKLKEPDLKL